MEELDALLCFGPHEVMEHTTAIAKKNVIDLKWHIVIIG